MQNMLKVSKWEVKRNLKNKSFIIGLFLTPFLLLLFYFIPDVLNSISNHDRTVTFYVNDELNIVNELRATLERNDVSNIQIVETDLKENEVEKQLLENENVAYIYLADSVVAENIITLYTSENINNSFFNHLILFEQVIQQYQLTKSGFTKEQLKLISQQINLEPIKIGKHNDTIGSTVNEQNPFKKLIPGIFSGIILLSIIISGMMIFQSSSQEKKEKISEILLSSITPNELMKGKIIGYFILGIIQVVVWLCIILPILTWKLDFPVIKYLFVPELIVFLIIALLGYLLFAALFVGIGATIEDVSTSGNFQSLVLMLPFLPIIFINSVTTFPDGIIAKVTSFVPITSPAVLIMRLSILDQWPWGEIVIAIIVLIITTLLFMNLAGKIFKIGILLYGKNATPKEIWKWLWS